MPDLLKTTGIIKKFDGVTVLYNVSFELKKGEVHCLLGENGAGKSTLMKIISGIYVPDGGHILFESHSVKFSSPAEALQAGISTVHQELSDVPYMPVYENIFLGNELRRNGLVDKRGMVRLAGELCENFGVEIDVSQPMRNLSTGQSQLIEIIKAVYRRPKVLILDEPTSSLSIREIQLLFQRLSELRKQGVSTIYISHKLEELFEVGDRVTILRDGQVTMSGVSIKDIGRDEMIRAMVGRSLSNLYPVKNIQTREEKEIFRVQELTQTGVFNHVTFGVGSGEILGVAGLIGAGRTEVMEGIVGERKIDFGKIFIDGKEEKIHSPRDAIRFGVGFIPEDRRKKGIIPDLSVLTNITIRSLRLFSKFGLISKTQELEKATEIVNELGVKFHNINQSIVSLSGGNQQKVVLGKWLIQPLKVLILDEPTRGVDVGAKFEIYSLIRNIADKGVAVIVVSSELPELLGITDRIIVFKRGKISGELLTLKTTEEEVMQYAF